MGDTLAAARRSVAACRNKLTRRAAPPPLALYLSGTSSQSFSRLVRPRRYYPSRHVETVLRLSERPCSKETRQSTLDAAGPGALQSPLFFLDCDEISPFSSSRGFLLPSSRPPPQKITKK